MSPRIPWRRGALPRALLALLLASGLAGCATTRIVDTWQAEGLQASDLDFERVVAIAALTETSRQRIAEDALASEIERTRVVPAYTLLTREDRADVDRLRRVLEANGIDGAITLHLVGVEEEETYVPGTTRVYPMGYYGYYGTVGSVVYDPGYIRTDTYVVVETSLYDVEQGKLLWTGISRTLNPKDIDSLIEGIAEAARDELREEGLLE